MKPHKFKKGVDHNDTSGDPIIQPVQHDTKDSRATSHDYSLKVIGRDPVTLNELSSKSNVADFHLIQEYVLRPALQKLLGSYNDSDITIVATASVTIKTDDSSILANYISPVFRYAGQLYIPHKIAPNLTLKFLRNFYNDDEVKTGINNYVSRVENESEKTIEQTLISLGPLLNRFFQRNNQRGDGGHGLGMTAVIPTLIASLPKLRRSLNGAGLQFEGRLSSWENVNADELRTIEQLLSVTTHIVVASVKAENLISNPHVMNLFTGLIPADMIQPSDNNNGYNNSPPDKPKFKW